MDGVFFPSKYTFSAISFYYVDYDRRSDNAENSIRNLLSYYFQ